MTAWAPLLVPAGSAMVGALIGGGATIAGQLVTNGGTRKREREARRDAFQVKRFEIERDTLIALQDVIQDHHAAWGLVAVREHLDTPEWELMSNMGKKTTEATKLAARVLDEDTRAKVHAYLTTAHATLQGDPTVSTDYATAQAAIGAALRRNPFEAK